MSDLDYVKFTVTNSSNTLLTERRFAKNLTVRELKEKLELITGILSNDMQLEIRPPEVNDGEISTKIQRLSDDSRRLNSYDIQDGCVLHVIDSSDDNAQSSDQVEKYVMSDEAYEKRTDTVRHFKQQLQLGRFDPSRGESPKTLSDKEYSFKVGDRCKVELDGQMPKRGTIMYFGKTDFKPGLWVGVQYDEPVGKHNGTVDGKTYFQCPPKRGAFVRPDSVTAGDFPELFDEEMGDLLEEF